MTPQLLCLLGALNWQSSRRPTCGLSLTFQVLLWVLSEFLFAVRATEVLSLALML